MLDTFRVAVGAPTSDLPALAMAAGVGQAVRYWLPLLVALVLLAFVFRNRDFRATPEMIVGGIVVGATFLIELAFLKGRERLQGYPLDALIVYE